MLKLQMLKYYITTTQNTKNVNTFVSALSKNLLLLKSLNATNSSTRVKNYMFFVYIFLTEDTDYDKI